jgi:hypothetical protein
VNEQFGFADHRERNLLVVCPPNHYCNY